MSDSIGLRFIVGTSAFAVRDASRMATFCRYHVLLADFTGRWSIDQYIMSVAHQMSSRWQGELVPHRLSPPCPVERIAVTIARTGSQVALSYTMIGDLAGIALPTPGPPQRCDGLWKASCFEFFARVPKENTYIEWNFSPSSAWAAYTFDEYRTGMRKAEIFPPSIVFDGRALTATVDVALLSDAPWQIGLSAVILDRDGRTSYWALAHPPGDADFHHMDCFTVELAPSQRA